MNRYHEIAFGAGAHRRQRERGSYDGYRAMGATSTAPDELGPDEVHFLQERDSLYLASVGETGWPYVQHRGGPSGFVKVLGSTTIAWAERSGNRQYVSAGNVETSDRVAIIAVDYPNRRRLKLYGHATYLTDPADPRAAAFVDDGAFEAIVVVAVEAFDWNCPKFITRRYTADQIREIVDPLKARIVELEEAAAGSVAKPTTERLETPRG